MILYRSNYNPPRSLNRSINSNYHSLHSSIDHKSLSHNPSRIPSHPKISNVAPKVFTQAFCNPKKLPKIPLANSIKSERLFKLKLFSNRNSVDREYSGGRSEYAGDRNSGTGVWMKVVGRRENKT